MLVYGLTGGIGSGKSTVGKMLRERGAEVVDADEVARAVVQPGSEGLARVVEAFGADILDASGALDRKQLGAHVFADPAARARLNAITHPLIAAETARRLGALRDRGIDRAFYEAALLVENGAHKALDGLITVEASEATQRARIEARDGLTAAEVERRLAAQTSNAARREAAELVIVNDGSLEALAAKVDRLWSRLQAGGPLREAG